MKIGEETMTSIGNDPCFIELADKARFVLSVVLTEARGDDPPDELDCCFLDAAADAQAAVFIIDATMKNCGMLSHFGADTYASAIRTRDAALASLKIKNPWPVVAN